MAVTLNDLLAESSLDLSLVVEGEPGALDDPIVWVHASESTDPTPYLEGGELLLLTGLQMPDDEPTEELRLYASRLAGIGIRGIGFGIEVNHPAIPQWLVDQCEHAGVPLLSVPLETPFIAISKRVSRGVADSKNQEFARMYRAQQQLIRSARQVDPVRGIVTKTAQLVGGWAALLNPAGKVRESSHHFLPVGVEELSDALTFSKLGETHFFQAKGYDIAVLHVATPAHVTLGYLVAGCRGVKGSLDQTLCAEAATMLALAIGSSSRGTLALTHFRTALTRDCLEGRSEDVHRYADDLWGGMPHEPLEVLRVMGEPDAIESAARLLEPFGSHIARNMNPVMYGEIDDELWVVVSQSNVDEWLVQLGKDTRLTVGESSGCTWRGLPRGRHEAFQAGAEALASGERSVRYGSGGSAAALERVIDPATMRAFADLRLAPISTMTFDISVGAHRGGGGGAVGGGAGDAAASSSLPRDGVSRAGESYAGADGDGADSSPSAGSRTGRGGNVDNSTTIQAVDVVRAWVDSRGRVEEAARRIGVHRHTMTKYIARIGEAMHVSMDDPGVMAELWYACRYTRFGTDRDPGFSVGRDPGFAS